MQQAHPRYVREWITAHFPAADRGRLYKHHIDAFNRSHLPYGIQYESMPYGQHAGEMLYGGKSWRRHHGQPPEVPLLSDEPVPEPQPEREEFTKIVILVPKGSLIFTD